MGKAYQLITHFNNKLRIFRFSIPEIFPKTRLLIADAIRRVGTVLVIIICIPATVILPIALITWAASLLVGLPFILVGELLDVDTPNWAKWRNSRKLPPFKNWPSHLDPGDEIRTHDDAKKAGFGKHLGALLCQNYWLGRIDEKEELNANGRLNEE